MMKTRDENKALLCESVNRLQAYPPAKRKQLFLKGLAVSMAKLKDKNSSAKRRKPCPCPHKSI